MSGEISETTDSKEKNDNSSEKKNKTKLKSTKKKDSQNEEDYDGEEKDNDKVKENNKKKKTEKSEDDEGDENENEEDADDQEEEEPGVDETDGRRKKRSLLAEEDVDVEAAAEQEIKKPANSLAAKKSVAQGMMDIALITANANQLRYMVEYNQHSSTFYINVILIIISLILQLGIGMALIYKTWLYMQGKSKQPTARKLNIFVTAGVFAITIINVFIASFTVTGQPPAQV